MTPLTLWVVGLLLIPIILGFIIFVQHYREDILSGQTKIRSRINYLQELHRKQGSTYEQNSRLLRIIQSTFYWCISLDANYQVMAEEWPVFAPLAHLARLPLWIVRWTMVRVHRLMVPPQVLRLDY